MRSDPLPLPKVYSPNRFWRAFILIFPFLSIVCIILAILTMIPALNDSVANNIVPMLLLLCLSAILIFLYIRIKSTRLVLSQEGMTYYSLEARMYTPWHNVVGIERMSFLFPLNFRKYMGLKLREKAIVPGKLEDGLRYGVAVIGASKWLGMAIYAGIFPIGFGIIGRNWQNEELGAYIRQYAPQVFGEAPMMSEYSFREYIQ
jgi:hypothetical protein